MNYLTHLPRVACLFFWIVILFTACSQILDGPKNLARGQELFRQGKYDEAAADLWRAVLLHSETPKEQSYDVQDAFQLFMKCYIVQGKAAAGLAFVASESFKRGQIDMGKNYLSQALSVDPESKEALSIKEEFGYLLGANSVVTEDEETTAAEDQDLLGKSPEELYEIASEHFANKNYEECADIFEISCEKSGKRLGPSCANAVYCRTLIMDYGFNGTRFDKDMVRISTLTKREKEKYRSPNEDGSFVWQRTTSVHPHMMLGFPVDPMLKRYVAEATAYMDEKMARLLPGNKLPDLPSDMPFNIDQYRSKFLTEVSENPSFRIRVGFVGSGFNSKAVMYLSHDMFRFFDPNAFEVHVFSFGPPDHPLFIQHGMRGVDWRERVKANVQKFHDCQSMKMDHIKAARYINDQNIHILIEWDGYARQGERAQGLFALRPAPVQILHQEYLGTSGALYVDYIITDKVTSPPELHDLFTEKFIYMPNHFFSKGHAYQAEVKKPTYDYSPMVTPYKEGSGSPQENRCLAKGTRGPAVPSFVFCNFNKFLKANPAMIRSWIRILREVPDSILCLLENPKSGLPYFRKFVHETAGTSTNHSDPDTFVPGDGDELNERIHFLPWQNNPFDHQMRNQDFCNIMLDSYPYNGHTVAQDALYGGVPIVTRSDGADMSSRVTTSANVVLGLEDLNAMGQTDYEDAAIRIATNKSLYNDVRQKLISTALQRNPMHPYWDVARYVKNFQAGLTGAWNRFVQGEEPDHIWINETQVVARGTFDDEILAHPAEGTKRSFESEEL